MNTNGFQISRTIIILIVLGVLVLLAVSYLLVRTKEDPGTVSVTGIPATATEANFITLASQLDGIVFDTSVLVDPRFLSLQDIHTAVLPESAGRPDPFAPLTK
jgi:hypothetical protein